MLLHNFVVVDVRGVIGGGAVLDVSLKAHNDSL